MHSCYCTSKTRKSESNSQLGLKRRFALLVVITLVKLENLKAIHNTKTQRVRSVRVVIALVKLENLKAIVNVDLDHIQLSSELLSALYRVIASSKQFDKGPVLLYITGNLEKELKLDADTQKVEIITQDVFYHTIEKTKRELREASICAYFDPFIEYNEEMLDTVCGFINEYNVAASLHEPYKLLPYINNSIDEGKKYDVLISFSDSLSPEATCEVSRIKAKEKWLISLGGCSDSVRDSINRFYLCGSQLFMSLVSQKQKEDQEAREQREKERLMRMQREREQKHKVRMPKKNSNTNEKNKKDKNAAAFMENFLKKHDESEMDLDPQ